MKKEEHEHGELWMNGNIWKVDRGMTGRVERIYMSTYVLKGNGV